MKKILIVDDEYNTTASIAIGMKRYGFHVETANNGTEGLEKIQEQEFDYVVCDIEMPGMNGWELSSKISTICPSIKIIFMTAVLKPNVALNISKSPILIKPFELKELISLL